VRSDALFSKGTEVSAQLTDGGGSETFDEEGYSKSNVLAPISEAEVLTMNQLERHDNIWINTKANKRGAHQTHRFDPFPYSLSLFQLSLLAHSYDLNSVRACIEEVKYNVLCNP
jgi:hypothetical protein